VNRETMCAALLRSGGDMTDKLNKYRRLIARSRKRQVASAQGARVHNALAGESMPLPDPFDLTPDEREESRAHYINCMNHHKHNHRFFYDCGRERLARFIDWGFRRPAATDEVWFWTGTFRGCPTKEHAERTWYKYIARLDAALSAYHAKAGVVAGQARWVLVWEWQDRGSIHGHAIISLPNAQGLSKYRWQAKWDTLAGLCRIGPYRPEGGPYLVKYLLKEANGGRGEAKLTNSRKRPPPLRWPRALVCGGDWRGMTEPQALACCSDKGKRPIAVIKSRSAPLCVSTGKG